MTLRRRCASLVSALLGIAAIIAPLAAHAYVPPSAFIIKSMAAKHSGVKGIRVRGLVSSFQGGESGGVAGPRFHVSSVFIVEGGVVRSCASDEQGKVLFVAERKIGATLDVPSAVDALLFDSQFRRLATALKKQALPIRTEEELLAMKDEEERRASEVLSLGRWKKSQAWIIGGKDEHAESQLWVEKDTFLPLRLIVDLRASDGPREAQFDNFRFFNEFPYPRLITWVERNQAILREELSDILANPPELKNFGKPLATGMTEAGEAASSEVRDLLRKYFETLR
ncbi:MAG: hypothetical protein NDJ90_03155 [Oligoflexia bacterium]|nr:hypothetical protein [Oligoflexia bacterium]